jgi:hypothetical protein
MGDHVENRAATAGLRIDVAAIAQVRCVEQLLQRRAAATSGNDRCVHMAIVGEPPAGVPRQAECHDRLAAQQRLEAHLRRNGIDLPDPLQQRRRTDIGGQQAHARITECSVDEIAGFLAAHHVGMRLDPDRLAGVFGERGGKHRAERRRVGPAQAHGDVTAGLVDDQDRVVMPVVRGNEIGCVVVFRQAVANDQGHCVVGLDPRFIGMVILQRGGVLHEHLETGWPAGVVVDAQIVDDDRQGGIAENAQGD